MSLLNTTKFLTSNSSPEVPPSLAIISLETVPPKLKVYRERGHRRLAARTYEVFYSSCMWGARMPVEIIIDNWYPRGMKKYRFETFCYGPLNCKLYNAGPNRKVEGRNGMVYVEEDWVDAIGTRTNKQL